MKTQIVYALVSDASLFEQFGLYNENLRIVADLTFILKRLLMGMCQ